MWVVWTKNKILSHCYQSYSSYPMYMLFLICSHTVHSLFSILDLSDNYSYFKTQPKYIFLCHSLLCLFSFNDDDDDHDDNDDNKRRRSHLPVRHWYSNLVNAGSIAPSDFTGARTSKSFTCPGSEEGYLATQLMSKRGNPVCRHPLSSLVHFPSQHSSPRGMS